MGTEENIELTDTNLNFTGKSNGEDYEVHIEFFKNVKSTDAESKYKVAPRSIQFYVLKEKEEDEFWPRLLKDKLKEKNQVKIDWDRYVDEDEEEDQGGFDTSGMDGSMGMGGMGGMGGGMPPGMDGSMGMGGMGGGMPPGMDMESLMKQMGNMGGDMSGLGADDIPNDDEDSDDDDGSLDDSPDLEGA